MSIRSLRFPAAALASLVFVPAAALAQVIPFQGNFGQGLSPQDNQMMFESVARLNAAERARSGSPIRGPTPRRKVPAPPRLCGCSGLAVCPAM